MNKAIDERLSDLLLELNYLQHLVGSHNINASVEMIITLRKEITKLRNEVKNDKR